MKIALMIAITVISDAFSDLLVTRGMRQVGDIPSLSPKVLFSIAIKAFSNISFLMGILLMAIYFFAFLTVLSWADLSFVFPATILSYVVSTLGAKFFLKETVNFYRWTGITLVCLGVAIISA